MKPSVWEALFFIKQQLYQGLYTVRHRHVLVLKPYIFIDIYQLI